MPARAEPASWPRAPLSCLPGLPVRLGAVSAVGSTYSSGRDAALGARSPLVRSRASLPERGTWSLFKVLSCFLDLGPRPAPVQSVSPVVAFSSWTRRVHVSPWVVQVHWRQFYPPVARSGCGNRIPPAPQLLFLARPVWVCSTGSSSSRFLEPDEECPRDLMGCSGSSLPTPASMDRSGRGDRVPSSLRPLVLAWPVLTEGREGWEGC